MSGILQAPLPTRFGGLDADLPTCADALRRLAAHAPSAALGLAMAFGNAAITRIPAEAVPALHRARLESGKEWVAEQVRQGKILAVANSEPGAGGDIQRTQTLATIDADGAVRLTGKKSFATFGQDADFFLCVARREAEPPATEPTFEGWFVSRHADGVHVEPHWQSLGLQTSASVGITLTNAPAATIMGFPGSMTGCNARHWSTVLFGAVFTGIGQGAIRHALELVRDSPRWTPARVAEAALTLEAGDGFLRAVAREECWPPTRELRDRTQRAKTFAAKAAIEAATFASIVGGGRAYQPHHPIARLLRDAIAGPILRPPMPMAMEQVIDQLPEVLGLQF